MGITIEKVETPNNWDEELKIHNGSIFLSSVWLESLKTDDRKPVYLVFKFEDDSKAWIAGFERPILNSDFKQLFFFTGIITHNNDPNLTRECKISLVEFCRKNNYSRIIMKSYDYFEQLQVQVEKYITFWREECVISLLKTEEELINNISKRYRTYIRKGKRNGIVFKYGHSPELLKTFYDLLEDTYEVRKSKGYGKYKILTMPFLEYDQMKQLLENNAAFFYYVEKNHEILSMQFLIIFACRAYMLLIGTSPLGYKLNASFVLIHDSIIKLKKDGILSYNLGGVPLGKENIGVKRFKMVMGATSVISVEETTDFLLPPLKSINYLLKMKRLFNNMYLPWIIKKQLLKILNLFLKDKDQY